MQTADFETDAGRAAKVAERRAREIDSAFRKAGTTIGIALGAGLAVGGAALRKYVQNTIEAEQVQAQLTSRIKDTGAAAGRTLEQLNAQADILQRMTIFDDEAIGEAQAALLVFKQVQGLQFDNTIAAATDLATVMGTDVADAAKLLGKALSDPEQAFGALRKAGVVFTEGQRDAIKAMADAGDIAGAQDAILKQLSGTMGSAAEAARGTLGGAIQGLKNDFENLLEGDAGSDGVRGTVDAVNALSRTLNDPGMKSGIDSVATGLLGIANSAIQVVAKLGNVGAALIDVFGAAEKRSLNVLKNQYTDFETELFQLGRKSGMGYRWREQAIKDEMATLEGLIGKHERAARAGEWMDGRVTRKSGSGQWANVTSDASAPRALTPPLRASGGAARRTSAPQALPKFMAEDEAALRKMVDQAAAADQAFARLAATLAGPLAEAEYAHTQALQQIGDLGSEAGRNATEVVALKALETERYEAQRTAIEATLNPMQALLDTHTAELEMIGLSNIERAMMNALREKGIDLASTEAAAYMASATAATAQLAAMDRDMAARIEGLDAVRDSFRGLAKDIAAGVEPVDALKNAFVNLAAKLGEMALDRIIESIFGAMGTAGGGSSGNFIASLLGSLVGGPRAYGGPVADSRPYLVGERGPEIFVPNTAGRIAPNLDTAKSERQTQRLRIVLVENQRDAEAMMRGSRGEEATLIHIERNSSRIRELLVR